jgi:hypothetical protein
MPRVISIITFLLTLVGGIYHCSLPQVARLHLLTLTTTHKRPLTGRSAPLPPIPPSAVLSQA